nr:hypothetical protein [Raoultella planticola]
MNTEIKGGIDIAMKVPPHQYQQTLDFYRQTLRLPEITDKAPATGFILGPNRLWIDEAPGLSQAEVWLELFTPDFHAASRESHHGTDRKARHNLHGLYRGQKLRGVSVSRRNNCYWPISKRRMNHRVVNTTNAIYSSCVNVK